MSSGKYLSFAGQTLIVDGIRVGATSSGSDGTEMTSTEVLYLDGLTPGTAAASKAVVLGSSKEISTLGAVGMGALTATTGDFSGLVTSDAGFDITSTTAVSADTTPTALSFGQGIYLVSNTNDANDIVDLPTAGASDVGKKIEMYAVEGFEIQCAESGAKINNVDASAGNEAAVVAGDRLVAEVVAAATWIVSGHSIIGAPKTYLAN